MQRLNDVESGSVSKMQFDNYEFKFVLIKPEFRDKYLADHNFQNGPAFFITTSHDGFTSKLNGLSCTKKLYRVNQWVAGGLNYYEVNTKAKSYVLSSGEFITDESFIEASKHAQLFYITRYRRIGTLHWKEYTKFPDPQEEEIKQETEPRWHSTIAEMYFKDKELKCQYMYSPTKEYLNQLSPTFSPSISYRLIKPTKSYGTIQIMYHTKEGAIKLTDPMEIEENSAVKTLDNFQNKAKEENKGWYGFEIWNFKEAKPEVIFESPAKT